MSALRDGEDAAYEMLWVRHIVSARRVARRLAPAHAEDLVSEAFLAVYEQIRVQGKGPTAAFRAYLFTVMRNIAARWHREGTRLVLDPDIDAEVEDDSWRNLEREYDGRLLLNAFRALPERWQRVLWLSEIEDVARPVIAAELGIRANAVSALHRRARSGLRVQWLLEQVPADLRHDSEHVAAGLPAIIAGRGVATPQHVRRHLAACERCRTVEHELRDAYRDGGSRATSIGGLAALGVVLPVASSIWAPPVTIAAAAAVGFGVVGSAAALLGVISLGVGSGLFTNLIPVEDQAAPEHVVVHDDGSREKRSEETSFSATRAPKPVTPPPMVTDPVMPPEAESPDVATIDIFGPGNADDPGGFPDRPTPPAPQDPRVVGPPDVGDDAVTAPEVAVSAPSSSYLAPVLAGAVAAGSQVAVEVDGDTYLAVPGEAGAWSFDLRSLRLAAGAYEASVWTITDGVSSAAAAVAFEIDALGIEGFAEYAPVTLRDGMDEGLVFTVTGAPGGGVCLESDNGQSAFIPLAPADGTATRRLQFFAYGLYVLRLTACDQGFFGPDIGRTVSVTEGIFDPWIVEDEPRWELNVP